MVTTLRQRFKATRITGKKEGLKKVPYDAIANSVSITSQNQNENLEIFVEENDINKIYYIYNSKIQTVHFDTSSDLKFFRFLKCDIEEIRLSSGKLEELTIQDSKVGYLKYEGIDIKVLTLGNNEIDKLDMISGSISDYGIVFSEMMTMEANYSLIEYKDSFAIFIEDNKLFLDLDKSSDGYNKLWETINKTIKSFTINKRFFKGDFMRIIYYKIENFYLSDVSSSLYISISQIITKNLKIDFFQSRGAGFNLKYIKDWGCNKKKESSTLTIIASNLNQCVFEKCDFSSFDVYIEDSILRNMIVRNITWPRFKKYKSKHEEKLQKKRYSRQDMFLELKMLGKNSGDKDMELLFKRYELNEQYSFPKNLGDKILLLFSKSNSFGTDWVKALILYIIISAVLYFGTLYMDNDYSVNGLGKTIYHYAYIFDPTHKIEMLFPYVDLIKNPKYVAIDFLCKLVSSFFIFQIIVAFRKYSGQ